MLKRVLLYVRRKYKRTALLLVLLFVITFSLAIGLSIHSNINKVVADIEQSLGTSFTFKARIDENNPKMFETHTSENGVTSSIYIGPAVNQALVDEILKVRGVTECNAEKYTVARIEGLQLIGGQWAKSYDMALNADGYLESSILSLETYKMRSETSLIYGNTDTALFEKFRSGAFVLKSGRHLNATDRKKALISEDIAQKNALELGDVFSVSINEGLMTGGDPDKRLGNASLEIIGIYSVNGQQEIGRFTSEIDIVYNWILTDNETVESVLTQGQSSRSTPFDNVTFFVDDPKELESVMRKAQSVSTIDPYYYDISADDTAYKATVEPLRSVKMLITITVLVIVIGCMIVLSIVFAMWVKGRKREIGIYLSMGIEKKAIIGQLLLEALLVAALAFALTVATVQSVPDMIGNQLLQTTISADVPQQQEYTEEELYEAAQAGEMREMFAFQSGYTGPQQIAFTIRLSDWILLAVLEILVILFAISKACLFVFRQQPKQILADMS